MCFSPEVSFATAAVLIPTSMFCLWTAARKCPRLWPLAIVPCLFGMQQACEGVVWLGLPCPDGTVCIWAARIYLFFALAFWPTWFSVAGAIIETRPGRRRFLTVWAVASTAWFWLSYWPAVAGPSPLAPHVEHHSIRYEYVDKGIEPLSRLRDRVLYIISAAVPLLVTSLWRPILVPTVLAVISAAIAGLLYDHAFLSVWCLFAGVLSVSLVYTISTAENLGSRYGEAVAS